MEKEEEHRDGEETVMELKLTGFGRVLAISAAILITLAFVVTARFSFGGVLMAGLVWFTIYMYVKRRSLLKRFSGRELPIKDYIIVKRQEAEEAQRMQVENALDNRNIELTNTESRKWEEFMQGFHEEHPEALLQEDEPLKEDASSKRKSFNLFRKRKPKGRHRKP